MGYTHADNTHNNNENNNENNTNETRPEELEQVERLELCETFEDKILNFIDNHTNEDQTGEDSNTLNLFINELFIYVLLIDIKFKSGTITAEELKNIVEYMNGEFIENLKKSDKILYITNKEETKEFIFNIYEHINILLNKLVIYEETEKQILQSEEEEEIKQEARDKNFNELFKNLIFSDCGTIQNKKMFDCLTLFSPSNYYNIMIYKNLNLYYERIKENQTFKNMDFNTFKNILINSIYIYLLNGVLSDKIKISLKKYNSEQIKILFDVFKLSTFLNIELSEKEAEGISTTEEDILKQSFNLFPYVKALESLKNLGFTLEDLKEFENLTEIYFNEIFIILYDYVEFKIFGINTEFLKYLFKIPLSDKMESYKIPKKYNFRKLTKNLICMNTKQILKHFEDVEILDYSFINYNIYDFEDKFLNEKLINKHTKNAFRLVCNVIAFHINIFFEYTEEEILKNGFCLDFLEILYLIKLKLTNKEFNLIKSYFKTFFNLKTFKDGSKIIFNYVKLCFNNVNKVHKLRQEILKNRVESLEIVKRLRENKIFKYDFIK